MDQPRRVRVVAAAVATGVLALLPVGVAHAVTGEGPGPVLEPDAPVLGLDLVPVVGDDGADGHLRQGIGSDLLSLVFAPDRPDVQHAVFRVTVTNAGDVPLRGITVHGPRLGTVWFEVTDLGPGASATARAVLEVTGEQAHTDAGGLFDVVATASGTMPDDEVVATESTARFEVVAILATLSAEATLEVLPGLGDVGVGEDGVPIVTWPDGEVDAVRRVPLRLSVVNTGDLPLHGLRAALEVLGTTTEVAVADELAPGAEVVLDLAHEVRRAEVVAAGTSAPMTTQVTAVVTIVGADASGTRPLSLRGSAALLAVVGRDEVVLPAAGPPTRPELALVALLSLGLGASLLLAAPRPRPRAG